MDGLLRFHAHHHHSIGHEQRVFSSFLHFHRIKDPFSSLLFRWPSKSETAPIPEQYPGAANEIWTDWYSESRRPSEYQILCFLVWFDMYLVMALILSHCINCGWLNSTTLALGFSVIEFSTLFFFFHWWLWFGRAFSALSTWIGIKISWDRSSIFDGSWFDYASCRFSIAALMIISWSHTHILFNKDKLPKLSYERSNPSYILDIILVIFVRYIKKSVILLSILIQILDIFCIFNIINILTL